MKERSIYYRRNLPHIIPFDGKFFITYRLFGSLPKHIIDKYINEIELIKSRPHKQKEITNTFFDISDYYLDNNAGIHYLRDDKVAQEVINSLHFYDEKYFELICFTVMSNHVHVIIDCNGYEDINLSLLFGRIKGFSSNKCKKILNIKNKHFWAQESYDHLIRNDNELEYYIKYVINNPVNANIVSKWDEYKYTYLKDKYRDNNLIW